MTGRRRVLLINPRITSRRSARFPLSVMALAAALGEQYESILLDGNLIDSIIDAAREAMAMDSVAAVGITVMGGPQVATAIEISRAIRILDPHVPIVWGGYFPSLYPEVTLNCDYVDFVIKGQGEQTFAALLAALEVHDPIALRAVAGLSWRHDGVVHHNQERSFDARHITPRLPYELLPNPGAYLVKTFLGERTAGHQAALGCRFRCTFCGVAAMFNGSLALPVAARLDRDLSRLRNEIGADSVQFYDHNFFDREDDMIPLLEVLARHQMPWWCYARADALVNLSSESWRLVRQSRLRMAYIGAETPNDDLLRSIRKGTRSAQTLEVAQLCSRHGVVPELSFMVAPPEDPEGETERTFEFIRKIKRVSPNAEIIVYINTPLPPECVPNADRLDLPTLTDTKGRPVRFPQTPDEWTAPQWVDYACHADAPWLTDQLRQRIRGFVTVLRCRFPTVQDMRSPPWAKLALRGLASWRYALKRYDRPWELNASHRLIGLLDPRIDSI